MTKLMITFTELGDTLVGADGDGRFRWVYLYEPNEEGWTLARQSITKELS